MASSSAATPSSSSSSNRVPLHVRIASQSSAASNPLYQLDQEPFSSTSPSSFSHTAAVLMARPGSAHPTGRTGSHGNAPAAMPADAHAYAHASASTSTPTPPPPSTAHVQATMAGYHAQNHHRPRSAAAQAAWATKYRRESGYEEEKRPTSPHITTTVPRHAAVARRSSQPVSSGGHNHHHPGRTGSSGDAFAAHGRASPVATFLMQEPDEMPYPTSPSPDHDAEDDDERGKGHGDAAATAARRTPSLRERFMPAGWRAAVGVGGDSTVGERRTRSPLRCRTAQDAHPPPPSAPGAGTGSQPASAAAAAAVAGFDGRKTPAQYRPSSAERQPQRGWVDLYAGSQDASPYDAPLGRWGGSSSGGGAGAGAGAGYFAAPPNGVAGAAEMGQRASVSSSLSSSTATAHHSSINMTPPGALGGGGASAGGPPQPQPQPGGSPCSSGLSRSPIVVPKARRGAMNLCGEGAKKDKRSRRKGARSKKKQRAKDGGGDGGGDGCTGVEEKVPSTKAKAGRRAASGVAAGAASSAAPHHRNHHAAGAGASRLSRASALQRAASATRAAAHLALHPVRCVELLRSRAAATVRCCDEAFREPTTRRRTLRPAWLEAYVPLLIWLGVSLTSTFCVLVWHTEVFTGLDRLANTLQSWGWKGRLAMGFLIFLTTFPPLPLYSTLIVLSGFAFGLVQGFIVSYVAALSGAVVVFLLSRSLLRSWMVRLLRRSGGLKKVVRAIEKRPKLLFLVRLAPYPYNLMNTLLASSPTLTLQTYATCTALALPKLLVHCGLGTTIKNFAAYNGVGTTDARAGAGSTPTSTTSALPSQQQQGEALASAGHAAETIKHVAGFVGVALCIGIFLYLFRVASSAVDELDDDDDDDDGLGGVGGAGAREYVALGGRTAGRYAALRTSDEAGHDDGEEEEVSWDEGGEGSSDEEDDEEDDDDEEELDWLDGHGALPAPALRLGDARGGGGGGETSTPRLVEMREKVAGSHSAWMRNGGGGGVGEDEVPLPPLMPSPLRGDTSTPTTTTATDALATGGFGGGGGGVARARHVASPVQPHPNHYHDHHYHQAHHAADGISATSAARRAFAARQSQSDVNLMDHPGSMWLVGGGAGVGGGVANAPDTTTTASTTTTGPTGRTTRSELGQSHAELATVRTSTERRGGGGGGSGGGGAESGVVASSSSRRGSGSGLAGEDLGAAEGGVGGGGSGGELDVDQLEAQAWQMEADEEQAEQGEKGKRPETAGTEVGAASSADGVEGKAV